MPQWSPFLVVTGLVTVAILLLARHSQQLIRDELASDSTTDHSSESHHPAPEREPDGQYPNGSVDSLEFEQVGAPDDQSAVGNESTVHGRDGRADGVGQSASAAVEEESTHAERGTTNKADARQQGHASPRMTGVELTTGLLLANVAVTQALVALVLLAAIWYFSIPAWALGVTTVVIPGELVTVGFGIGFGLVLWVGNELSTNIADAVGASYDESVRELLAPESTVGWLALFGIVLPLIAFAEELLFRAALIGVPAAAYGVSPWLLAIVSSAAFALGHGAQGRVGIAVTGALGFVLAGGYIVSGSLLLVVVAHYVINAMEFFVHEYLGYHDFLSL